MTIDVGWVPIIAGTSFVIVAGAIVIVIVAWWNQRL